MSSNCFSENYNLLNGFVDEMFKNPESVKSHYNNLFKELKNTPQEVLLKKEALTKKMFESQGVTFTVYNDGAGVEKIFPFDIIPRIIQAQEWQIIEEGIKQRLKALNHFLKDVYHEQFILKDGVFPSKLIASCPHYLKEMVGLDVPKDIYVHISGVDLIRHSDGNFYVLEDNLRTPSGVSYVLENREISKRIFPNVIPKSKVRPVSTYPNLLHTQLCSFVDKANPEVVLLTPGMFNSAYYEHATLARLMGISLVEGNDLVVKDHFVYKKTISGLKKVDVIYRRVDDSFLDPLYFNPTSVLGVPGIMSAYQKGNVVIVNAPGTGIADDKATYIYVPDMIRYYLNEEPILNNIKTYQLGNLNELDYVLKNIDSMVVKQTNGSGGYGMLMGSSASEEEIEDYIKEIKKNPREYIAQPTIKLSTSPCLIDGKLAPRCVDLRPFAVTGAEETKIIPGGLTRVALKEGSLVVNSSQGGGSKDTWVLK